MKSLDSDVLTLRIDPQVTFQTMDNFGGSDAWQCDIVGKNWPLEKRERIADLLFSRETDANGNPKGIGLSLWRFYLSAGTAEQGDDSDIENVWRRGECFLSADGSYDWSKQSGQQWFLKAAQERGVEQFLAFPNSPPVPLTLNGKGYAPKGDIRLNIKPGKLADYAVFLAEVMEHFQNEGIPFDYVSPFNEPQWGWDGTGQEGTPAQNTEIYCLLRYLSKELSRRNLSTQIVIGEAGTIGHAGRVMDNDGRDNQAEFFFNPDSPFYIGDLPNVAVILSAHSYFSVWPLDKQAEHRQEFHRAMTQANPELGYWQSEYCILEKNDEIGGGGGRDLGMDTALFVARIIHNDITLAQARSWQWWTSVSQVDFKDGLVYLDDGSEGDSGKMGPETASLLNDGEVRDSKLLWTLGNYSRFIHPGMVRIACEIAPEQSLSDGVLASAYRADNGQVTVVLTNLSAEAKSCHLGEAHILDIYTTSATGSLTHNHQRGDEIPLPARSVTTCIIPA